MTITNQSKKTINVIRFVIFNFHAMFREYRQLNKSMMNFADRSFFSIMQIFLIKLLNEINKKILIMHQFSQKQKFLTDQNFDLFSFYKYLMSESEFFQFFTINSDEILLKNQSILNSDLNISFRNENHFIISSAVTITENKNFVFKSFSNSDLILSFQNKNHFNQLIRIIRSMNQKSIDQFSNHVAIFNLNLHENSLFFFHLTKKIMKIFVFLISKKSSMINSSILQSNQNSKAIIMLNLI